MCASVLVGWQSCQWRVGALLGYTPVHTVDPSASAGDTGTCVHGCYFSEAWGDDGFGLPMLATAAPSAL